MWKRIGNRRGMKVMRKAERVPPFPTDPSVQPPDHRMSLRDYFAGQALAGICGDSIPGSHHRPAETAKAAYEYADMMLREREKRGA